MTRPAARTGLAVLGVGAALVDQLEPVPAQSRALTASSEEGPSGTLQDQVLDVRVADGLVIR